MIWDVVIIGGGIVGLATAYRLQEAQAGLKIAIVEKEKQVAQHQTGHNSGVIHSGIYYKPGSLKAQNCREGYAQLLAFCEQESIPYELCGKLIVATNAAELPALDNILQRGKQNGLDNLKIVEQGQLREYEPFLQGIRGIWVPQTGIIDYKQVSAKLADKFQERGGEIFSDEKVLDLQAQSQALEIFTTRKRRRTRLMINCAGLFSDRVARMSNPRSDVRIIPFRGEYFKLVPEKRYLVRNLIYPVPNPNFPFLGVHFTRMLDGEVEAGPNAVFGFKREAYQKSDFNWKDTQESLQWPGFRKVALKYWQIGLGEMYRSWSKTAFTKALQKLIPDVKESDLIATEAGVRAQACDRKGGLLDDFAIREEARMIHVLNAPSPAATSSLSIGKTVSQMALAHLK